MPESSDWLTTSVSPTKNFWNSLNGGDFLTTRLGAATCHARPPGYLTSGHVTALVDLPRELLWGIYANSIELYFLHSRYVGRLDIVVDHIGVTALSAPSCVSWTHALEPVTRNVKGSSVRRYFMKASHSPSSIRLKVYRISVRVQLYMAD